MWFIVIGVSFGLILGLRKYNKGKGAERDEQKKS